MILTRNIKIAIGTSVFCSSIIIALIVMAVILSIFFVNHRNKDPILSSTRNHRVNGATTRALDDVLTQIKELESKVSGNQQTKDVVSESPNPPADEYAFSKVDLGEFTGTDDETVKQRKIWQGWNKRRDKSKEAHELLLKNQKKEGFTPPPPPVESLAQQKGKLMTTTEGDQSKPLPLSNCEIFYNKHDSKVWKLRCEQEELDKSLLFISDALMGGEHYSSGKEYYLHNGDEIDGVSTYVIDNSKPHLALACNGDTSKHPLIVSSVIALDVDFTVENKEHSLA